MRDRGGGVIWRRIAASERYALALEAAGAGTWHWDRRTGAVDWDPALEALYGLAEGTFGGVFDDWISHVHPEDRETVLATLDAALSTAGPYYVVYRTVWPDGSVHWIEGRGRVLEEGGEVVGMVGACLDVTERQRVEEERARVLEAEREAHERLEFLAEAGELLARSLDVERTLGDLAQLAVPRLGDWCVIELTDPRFQDSVAIVHAEPSKVRLAREVRERYGSTLGRPAGRSLLREGHVPDLTEDRLRAAAVDDEHYEIIRRLEPRSAVVVPLLVSGRELGGLTLVHAESGRRHSREDFVLAQELARRAAVAVENARLFAESNHVGNLLQRALLPPDLPELPGAELASHYESAGSIEIGGDFYDVLGAGNEWTLVIGDVRGKGAAAASLTSLVRHTVRAAALRDPDPANVLSVLNDALIEDDPMESFCTAVCASLRMRGGEATVVLGAGGHPQPLVLHADGSIETVGASGMLLGLFPDVEYETTTVRLHPGDVLFFYTDGLTEARRRDELFGTERVVETLAGATGMSAEGLVKHMHAAVTAFQAEQRDDMAMLALRLLPDTA